MKKIIVLTLITAILLSGCSDIGNATEIGSRAIIQAAAIDYDNGYRVSALLFSSTGSGGDIIDASEDNVIKVTGEGETLAKAIDNISLIDGKRIYMCETKLLILGSGFELQNIKDVLNNLYFDFRCSLNMPVCCAENAEMLTDMQFTEGITSAEKPLSIIENAFEKGVSPKTTLLDLLCDLKAERNSLIPMFESVKNGRGMTSGEDGTTAVLSGSRELENGYLGRFYDSNQTAALMLWRGLSDRTTVNYNFDGGNKTCEAYNIKIISDNRDDNEMSVCVSAKFRSRNGAGIDNEERKAALHSLAKLLENGIS